MEESANPKAASVLSATLPLHVFHCSNNEQGYIELCFSIDIPENAPETLVTWKGEVEVRAEYKINNSNKLMRLYFEGNGLCLLHFPDREKLISISLDNNMEPFARVNAKCLNYFSNIKVIRDTMAWTIQGNVSTLNNFEKLNTLQLSGMWGDVSEMQQDFSNIVDLSFSNSSVTGDLNKALKGTSKLGELMLESNDITFDVNGDGTSALYKLYCRHSPNVTGDLGNTHLLRVMSDQYNVFSWKTDRDTSLVPMTLKNVYFKTVSDVKHMIENIGKCKKSESEIVIDIHTIDGNKLSTTDIDKTVLQNKGIVSFFVNGTDLLSEKNTL